jgi:hypothetical protein
MLLPLLGALLPAALLSAVPLATSPLAPALLVHGPACETLAEPVSEADPVAEPEADPHHQFDFWVGEWSVQNRHMDGNGRWRDGDVTRARITPVIGGQAVLEEWAGPLHGAFMNGFSLRAYHPADGRRALLLFWTATGDGSFGQLHGRFRLGRGEFFAPDSGPRQTRYSFSDELFATDWTEGTLSPHPEARELDWLLGTWHGTQTDEAGKQRAARLDVR